MKNFTVGRATVYFESRDGVVVSKKSLTEPPSELNKGDDWIRTNDGKELCLDIDSDDFKLRVGDRVSVMFALNPVMQARIPVVVRNHDLASRHMLTRGDDLCDQLIDPSTWSKLAFYSMLAMIPAVICSFIYGMQWLIPPALGWSLASTMASRRSERVTPLLIAHIDALDTTLATRHWVNSALARPDKAERV
ncbi:hypothetical protein M5G22_24085 [Pseudomonas sp. TNT2022 ID233]|uniref:hypothetical protein n=1 Tax=Pseudomonas aphyarum TaxID=2942629 RepID=UPI00235E5CDA|nr:hypothetical protein [Pseudomonas aphyarum]MDD1140652.1 hypothetical protein [Pseudomonas aphyarum]